MNTSKFIFFGIIINFLSVGAHAHHSFVSHFDPSKTFEIEGVITEFVQRSPHSFFYVDSTDENGEVINWEVELASIVHLRRMGISKDDFQAGDKIKVAAWPNRVPGRTLVYGISFIDEQGATWGEYPESAVETASASVSGIDAVLGRWFAPLPKLQAPLPLNDAGKLAAENYDPQLSPATTCEPATIPDLQLSPYMTDIRIEDGMVNFIHEAYGMTRSIPLNAPPAQTEETGILGIASAHINGDELVIESSGYPASLWGLGGAAQPKGERVDYPSSTQKKVVERYSVSEDGQTITLAYTLEDPIYLTDVYSSSMTMRRVADDEPMYPFECEVEAAKRFSE